MDGAGPGLAVCTRCSGVSEVTGDDLGEGFASVVLRAVSVASIVVCGWRVVLSEPLDVDRAGWGLPLLVSLAVKLGSLSCPVLGPPHW